MTARRTRDRLSDGLGFADSVLVNWNYNFTVSDRPGLEYSMVGCRDNEYYRITKLGHQRTPVDASKTLSL